MRVLLTGAAGVLGRTVTGLLENLGGYDLTLTDVLPLETSHPFRQVDLAEAGQVQGLCEGVDQVLHIGAVHPWKTYTTQQYVACNIVGSHNIIEEAARAGVGRFIYTSSVAAMGYEITDQWPLPFDETRPCHPFEHIYNVSKYAGEQFCELHRHLSNLPSVFLRPGGFSPRDETTSTFGLGLLGIGVHLQDVAQAHVLALQSEVVNEAIIITAGVPFTTAEGAELVTDARSVILRHFPQAAALEEAGVELPQRLHQCYCIDKARHLLGYEPQVNFGSWLAGWLARREAGA